MSLAVFVLCFGGCCLFVVVVCFLFVLGGRGSGRWGFSCCVFWVVVVFWGGRGGVMGSKQVLEEDAGSSHFGTTGSESYCGFLMT